MSVEPKGLEHIRSVLEQFDNKYITDTGVLKRNNVIEDLDKYDRDLMTALLSDELIHNSYTEKIAGVEVFKLNQFIEMLEFKSYWEDSYTKYSNKIGLTADGKFIDESADVVLDFPFKDTVLKAGMNKEDVENSGDADEPFLNEVIAKTEIDELFEPKILVNAKKYDKDGETRVETISDDDNLVIKGNNLIALHSLKKRYAGKVKLIYLDPPYNTGSDSFLYNDRFNHASWLTFMKNRLEIAKELLSDDGFIWVQTDDGELNYLGVLLDGIFGRDNFINVVTVKTKIGGVSGSSEGKSLKDTTEFIQVYAKDKESIELKPIYATTPVWDYIKDEYIDAGKSWKYTTVLLELGEKKLIKKDDKNNRTYYYYPNVKTCSVKQYAKDHNMSDEEVYNTIPDKVIRSTNAQSSIRKAVVRETSEFSDSFVSIEYIPIKGKNKNRKVEVLYTKTKQMVMFLSDMLTEDRNGRLLYKEKLTTLWEDIQYNNLSKEGLVNFPNGKKPEKLLQNIIEMSTEEGDLVLDFFGGSGTTAATAHKLNRHYITCDQMSGQLVKIIERLDNVVTGKDIMGISKEVNWQGGGSFIYAELMEKNQGYLHDLQKADNVNELMNVYARMKENADIDFRLDLDKFESEIEQFTSLDERRRELIRILDKNQLYYNFANIDDENVRDLISDSDYHFNKSFYGEEGE